jgi:hypothetical protein
MDLWPLLIPREGFEATVAKLLADSSVLVATWVLAAARLTVEVSIYLGQEFRFRLVLREVGEFSYNALGFFSIAL